MPRSAAYAANTSATPSFSNSKFSWSSGGGPPTIRDRSRAMWRGSADGLLADGMTRTGMVSEVKETTSGTYGRNALPAIGKA